jgi:hypothetical protein
MRLRTLPPRLILSGATGATGAGEAMEAGGVRGADGEVMAGAGDAGS